MYFESREEMLNSQVLSVKVLNVDKEYLRFLKEPIKLVFRHLKVKLIFPYF